MTPTREPEKIILPPFVYQHEQEKIARRLPAAVEFIKEQKLNELFPGQYESLVSSPAAAPTTPSFVPCSARPSPMFTVMPISPFTV